MPAIPLPAAAGLLSGLALGLAACVMLPAGHGAPDQPTFLSGGNVTFQAEQQLVFAMRPAQLVGLSGAAVRQAFGEPEMRRRDPPAEVWQYRSPRCVLDLYFYGDPEREGVMHFESRSRDPRRPVVALPVDGCVSELAERRRPLV